MQAYVVTKVDERRFRIIPLVYKYGITTNYICDTSQQADRLRKLGVKNSLIHITHIEPCGIQGVSKARDFTVKNVMPKGQWSLWIDDNLTKITGLPFKYSKNSLSPNSHFRQLFNQEVVPTDFNKYIDETIKQAESLGTIFAAFANENNHFFRLGKWQYRGYCRTQLALYKNDGSSWFPFSTMMLEDMYKSIDVVARYGCIVLNKHLKAEKPMFEQGGIGSFKERLPWLQDNCKRLIEMYPGLLKYGKSGKQYGIEASNYHLKFAKASQKTIDKWRKENGYA